MDAFNDLKALQAATVPNVDCWHLTKLTRRYHASVDVTDRTADDFLIVLSVVALLTDRRVEEDDCAANKEDYFLVDELAALLELAANIACAFSIFPSHCVL